MITRHFRYVAPTSSDEVVAALDAAGNDAEILGGGTWVVTEMTSGVRRPGCVIDLGRAGLGSIVERRDEIAIGATVTYRDLLDSALVAERLPMLRTLALGITGGSQIWNRGTIGGSACYGNPQSDVPAAIVALEATLVLASSAGERLVPAAEFFHGAFETDVRAGEVLTELVIGDHRTARVGYYKFKLSESSWPIVTAAYVERDGSRRVTLGGVQEVPLTVGLDGAGVDAIGDAVAAAITAPYTDALAGGEYKRSIAGVIARRAAEQADGG